MHRLYEVQHKDKSPYEFVEFQPEVERTFAEQLDHNERVKLFLKLPGRFAVDTPIGPYNPDWALVYEEDIKVYLVRETKGTADRDDLRDKERRKTDYGRKYCETIGVDFKVVSNVGQALN